MHVDYELLIEDLPVDCIVDCSQPGQDVEPECDYWRKELDFTVNRNRAIDYIVSSGAHEREELDEWEDDRLANWILWQACCDFREFQRSAEQGHGDFGSDFFVLEAG